MIDKLKADFSGYATKANVKCTDGRTILPNAFKDSDGMTVPLVWQHMHDEPGNVLGHVLLENREDGVYSYGFFNNSENGKNSKLLIQHKDIVSLSVYANSLIEKSKLVVHGLIREVSLVMAGANPGAKIDYIAIQHDDTGEIFNSEEEAIIWSGTELDNNDIKHEDDSKENETVGDVFNTLSEKQKEAVYIILDELMGDKSSEEIENPSEEEKEEIKQTDINEGEETIMKHNVFEEYGTGKVIARPILSQVQFDAIMTDAKKNGSLKQSVISHAGTYGIDNIDYLFPDARAVTNEPDMVTRDMEWVPQVLDATRKSPFSRIKSLYADITLETARALGYIKGNLKKEEVFSILRRTTDPQTVYKKQKLDRDDIIDIVDLDVVAWMKREMQIMLKEELARAILISDGRDPVTQVEDKIVETHIRPIWKDDDIYSHKVQVALNDTADDVIDAIITARVNYKGSGSPVLFASPSFLTSMMLLKDSLGYRIYKTKAELEAALLVSKIVEVPVMENQVREAGATDYTLLGIIVNLKDYTVGADKGGETSFFQDFDIDYNQQKYLYETRISGALTKPKSALVIERATT
jgi:hypothetical protein